MVSIYKQRLFFFTH